MTNPDISVAVAFIGTSKYADFFPEWYDRVCKTFLTDCKKTVFAFSDRIDEEMFQKSNVVPIKIPHDKWPYVTLLRFRFLKAMLEHSSFKNSSHFIYLDADLFSNLPTTFSIVFGDDKKPLVGVQHPSNFLEPRWESFVKRGNSLSNVLINTSETEESLASRCYYQGCLWGGKRDSIIELIIECDKNVDLDTASGIVADWHDESHMNCYFLKRPDELRTLSCEFAFPTHPHYKGRLESLNLSPVLVHIDKDHKEFPRFSGAKR